MWAKSGAVSTICPKSWITAQSMAWIEEYLVRRKLGPKGIEGLSARHVEAFLVLEHELAGLSGAAGNARQDRAPSRRQNG